MAAVSTGKNISLCEENTAMFHFRQIETIQNQHGTFNSIQRVLQLYPWPCFISIIFKYDATDLYEVQ